MFLFVEQTKRIMENIRYRHGMYIDQIGNGDLPCDAIYTLLKEILMNSIDEHLAGYGKSIILDIHDNLVKVRHPIG